MTETVYEKRIQRAHECLDASSYYAALSNFMSAIEEATSPLERTRALQMNGVVFRKLGNLAKALEYGERALAEAADTTVPAATSGAARDLAATLHIIGIVREDDRIDTFRRAFELFDMSFKYHKIGKQPPFADGAAGDDDYYVTCGMRALLAYDAAHFRVLYSETGITSLKSRREVHSAQNDALTSLEMADHFLAKSDNRAWELNNLLKLIQISPVGERAQLINRAETLITLYPERNKELWAAISGRRMNRSLLKLKTRF